MRYWNEIAQYHANSETSLRSLEWLQEKIGPATFLHNIGDDTVARLVAERRTEMRHNVTDKKSGRVSNGTVNRTVTQPLRHILNRARRIWKALAADVQWSQHMLKEPKERIREASTREEVAIQGKLARGYDTAVAFAFASGCRRMEILGLRWEHVDFDGGRFTITGKGDKSRALPLIPRLRQIVEDCIGHHESHVFTYAALRTDKRKGLVKGKRYPLTEAGLKTAFRRAVPKAGVVDFRFHDTRHTMATRTLRKSNIRVVQQMLGHEDVATTAKYAHAVMADLEAAMDAASPTTIPTKEWDTVTSTEYKRKNSAL
ncbi:phage integrase family protein [Rhizobium sp. PP-F2F-G36]|nr:phage integrase family protein [Rhizobium sp. PP-F2F-G36]